MPDEYQRASDLAYRAVSQRDRTVAEVRMFLQRKRVEPDAIEHAVGQLAEDGWLDDARFAARFTEDKRTLERWGSQRIERELSRRGVAPELVEGVVAGRERETELRAAVEVLSGRLGTPPERDRERDRAWKLLVRKGYEPELAYEAVRRFSRSEAA